MYAMLVSVKKNYPALKRELVDDESFDLLLSEVERKDLEELVSFLDKFDCYSVIEVPYAFTCCFYEVIITIIVLHSRP